jgi:hypothetical protein
MVVVLNRANRGCRWQNTGLSILLETYILFWLLKSFLIFLILILVLNTVFIFYMVTILFGKSFIHIYDFNFFSCGFALKNRLYFFFYLPVCTDI